MIHVDKDKIKAEGTASWVMVEAMQALSCAVTISLQLFQEGMPEKDIDGMIDDLLGLAVNGAKERIRNNLEGIRNGEEGIELKTTTKEEDQCEEDEESRGVKEL